MAKFIGSKYFKSAGLSQYDMPQSMIDGIRRIENSYERLGNNQQRILANVVKYGLDNIEEVFTRYTSVVESGGNSGSKENLIYIYGELVGEQLAAVRTSNTSAAVRGNKSVVEYFIDSNKAFSDLGISYQQLSDVQKTRLCRVFEKYSLDQLSDFKTPIANFIKYDLTSYVGRITRIKATKTRGLYGYVLRYGKNIGLKKFEEDTAKRKVGLNNQEENWIARGLSKDEAREKVIEHNKYAASKAAEKLTGTSEYTIRSTAYWERIGLSPEEAKEKVKKIQNSWANYDGNKRKERIAKWLNKLNSIPDHIKEQIKLKKSHLPNGVMARKNCSLVEATRESERIFKNRNRYSKISQELFWAIAKELGDTGLFFQELNNECVIENKYVDFYDSISKTVVEFHGVYWHARDLADDTMVYGRSAKDIRDADRDRELRLTSSQKVNQYVIVWEDEFRKNKTNIVKSITNLIRANREIYGTT